MAAPLTKPIPPHSQLIAAAFTAAFFIGIYFCTFLLSLRGLLFTRKDWELRPANSVQWPILAVSLAILTMAAVNHGCQVKFWMDEALTTPPAVHIVNWLDITMCTTANFTAQLTDAILVFRLWKVYNNSYRIAAPAVLLWVIGLVLTALEIYLQVARVALNRVWLHVNVDLGPGVILTPFWASTVVLNLYATTMIIYQLWKFKQETFGRATEAIDFAASLIIESGSLYLIPAITHFVVWWTPSDFAINIASNINVAMLGTAFNVIIIRLAKRRDQEQQIDLDMTAMQFEQGHTVKTEHSDETGSSDTVTV